MPPPADRVLQVLAVLAQQGRVLTAGELMAHTGLARSTLYRLLARLKRWGFVLESDGCYAPGPLSLQLALGFDLSSHLVRQARPDMIALARQSHESVGLIVAVNDAADLPGHGGKRASRCAARSRRAAACRCAPAHRPSACWRICPKAAATAVLQAQYGDRRRARRPRWPSWLAIRQAGYAMTAGEVDPGVWGVSAPLFGAARRAVGALTLMAPVTRAQGQESALTDMTMVAAARISRGLSLP